MVTAKGKGFAQPTETGNKASRVRKLWENLLKTVRKNHDFRHLPFKFLRKTTGDLVKEVSNGEIAGVFLCHGQPVKNDSLADIYTNRPFGKVFEALN
jgi:hypothetical protein